VLPNGRSSLLDFGRPHQKPTHRTSTTSCATSLRHVANQGHRRQTRLAPWSNYRTVSLFAPLPSNRMHLLDCAWRLGRKHEGRILQRHLANAHTNLPLLPAISNAK